MGAHPAGHGGPTSCGDDGCCRACYV